MKTRTKFSVSLPKADKGFKFGDFLSRGSQNMKLGSMVNSAIPNSPGNDIRKGLEDLAPMAGPWGIAASAISKIGRAVDSGSKDKYGVYKNKGAAIADTLLDPVGLIQDAMTGNLFNQKELRRKKNDTIANEAINNQADQLDQAALSPKIPMYQPPAYGKDGMKIKTKFSKGGSISMTKGEFLDEHKHLLKALRTGDPTLLKKEANYQAGEVEEYTGKKLSSGGSINIKPENKGKFTSYAKSKGMSVQEAARAVLNNPNASPTLKKRANFARNASKWNH